jgi:hypothetical protein
MPRTSVLLEKSIAACISGIEIYNKPDFRYREETFAILMINAWELLFKAKILKDNKNQIKSIYVKQAKVLRSGQTSTKHYTVKMSRSGNPLSIELMNAIKLVDKPSGTLAEPLKENIQALCEIRDNAIHFKNDEEELGKIVLELGTASLKNYLNIVKKWFDKDLSKYNFYLMPLSFFHEFTIAQSFSVAKNAELDKLLAYLGEKARTMRSDPDHEYNLLLKVETKFVKSSVEDSLTVKTVRRREDAENPDAVREVILTEDDIMQRYPWSHQDLISRLKARYSDFKQDRNFNAHLKIVKTINQLSHQRLLYPSKLSSPKTFLYSPNCIPNYFDQHYHT